MSSFCVLVTGASRGIGNGLAEALLQFLSLREDVKSIELMISARNESALQQEAKRLPSLLQTSCIVNVSVLPCDLSCLDQTEKLFKRFAALVEQKKQNLPNVFVLSAAGVHETAVIQRNDGSWSYTNVDDFTEEEKQQTENINVNSPVLLYNRIQELVNSLQCEFEYVYI